MPFLGASFLSFPGARPLKRAIQQQIENPLAQQILSGELVPGKVIRLEVNEDRIVAVQ